MLRLKQIWDGDRFAMWVGKDQITDVPMPWYVGATTPVLWTPVLALTYGDDLGGPENCGFRYAVTVGGISIPALAWANRLDSFAGDLALSDEQSARFDANPKDYLFDLFDVGAYATLREETGSNKAGLLRSARSFLHYADDRARMNTCFGTSANSIGTPRWAGLFGWGYCDPCQLEEELSDREPADLTTYPFAT